MLHPESRALYLDALRPPPGYELDQAVGTVYSLDLIAALILPLAFTLFDVDDERAALADLTQLLDALDRHVARITLFHQAGRISYPKAKIPLFSHLEPMLVPVQPAHPSGVLHAKTWFLRFTPRSQRRGAGAPNVDGSSGDEADAVPGAVVRFLCLSRNLGFSNSWDTLLSLDGELTPAAAADSAQLADLIDALPDRSVSDMTAARRAAVKAMAADIRRTRFGLGDMEGRARTRFHTVGLTRDGAWPFDEPVDRLLVMSPFLQSTALDALAGVGRNNVLVSSPESLADVTEAASRFGEVYILVDVAADPDSAAGSDSSIGAAEQLGAADEEPATAPGDPADEEADDDPLEGRGLHAKLYIAESGGTARIWVGSSNATMAGLPAPGSDATGLWGRNIELLVELSGPKADFGIDAFLGNDPTGLTSHEKITGFRPLLRPWVPSALTDEEEIRLGLKRRAEELRQALLGGGFHLRIRPAAAGADALPAIGGTTSPDVQSGQVTGVTGAGPGPSYDLTLLADSQVDPAQAEVWAWPISVGFGSALSVATADVRKGIKFAGMPPETLTCFIAFEIRISEGGQRHVLKFVASLPAEGMPEERAQAVLRAILKDKRGVLRYLLLMLMDPTDPATVGEIADMFRRGDSAGTSSFFDVPLTEELIRSAVRAPDRIERVARFVELLGRLPDSDELLPDGLDRVWPAIAGYMGNVSARPVRP